MKDEEDRIPVIIGVGQVNDRPTDPLDGLDSLGLMRAALMAAQQDAGREILDKIDWLGVEDQISFPDPEIQYRLAHELPKSPSHVLRTELPGGEGPVRLIDDAANLIRQGAISIAAAVGGEALRTAATHAKAALASGQGRADSLAAAVEASARPLWRKYGLMNPTDVYPLYENATRAAWGLSLEEAQAETAKIWSGFSQVAANNPHAWLRKVVPADVIATPGADNRMVSFPYTKLMVANNSVNQGAGILIASLSMARRLGIAEDKIVYIGAGAAAHEPEDFLKRDRYDRSASLDAVITGVLERNRIGAADLDHVELYSCFPCIPKMARRTLGWRLDRPHSVYGGLTFGGGPIGNCMMHAAAAMVEKLRGGRGKGLIVANGGYATHNHAIILSSLPQHYEPALDSRVQAAADADRDPLPRLLDSYAGPGTVETYSIPFNRSGAPAQPIILARTPQGERFLAKLMPDGASDMGIFLNGNGVGLQGHAEPDTSGRNRWYF